MQVYILCSEVRNFPVKPYHANNRSLSTHESRILYLYQVAYHKYEKKLFSGFDQCTGAVYLLKIPLRCSCLNQQGDYTAQFNLVFDFQLQ